MADPEDGEIGPAARPAAGASPSDVTISESDTSQRPEMMVGLYRVLRLLGAGGMGDVFLAFDARLQRRVAIKRVRSDRAVTPRALERLRREALAVAALNHPAIVQIYDVVAEESGEAIVMEYVLGETLAQRRARAPLTAREAVNIGRQVAEGLAAAHAVGLIHRDLKTQNVMLAPSGQVKILDFGMAKYLRDTPEADPLTDEGSVLGTLRSMSPEQAQGQSLDARSDLFSLGVLLYEICTGRAPFQGESAAETWRKVVGEPPPATDVDLPPALRDLIAALLQKDPERRPASAAEVADRLGQIEKAWSRPGGVRSRGVWVTTTAVVLMVAAGAVTRHLRQGPTPDRAIAVLVTEPSIGAGGAADERSRLAAFAIREAVLRALTRLERVEAIGGGELPENPLSLEQTARAVAADEVVVPVLACQGSSCRVSVRRQRGRDGHILADSGPFDVSGEAEDALALSDAVDIHLGRLFADHPHRGTERRLPVQGADYERYLSLRRRMHEGEVLSSGDVDALEQILQSSPGLQEARLLAASTARALKDRARAVRLLRDVDPRDADDPRPAFERFLLELETGTVADAEAALRDFEMRAPGDLRLPRAQARLLIRQGRLQEAVVVLRRLLRARPSWTNLWYVADVEIDLGDAGAARAHLHQLLEVSPGNPRGRAKLAELEWFLGEPERAVRIYEELLTEHETWENVSNLGWSRLLAGDYPAAVRAYRRALELQPDHLPSRLNLGIAYTGLGDPDGARRVYEQVLERIRARDPRETLSVSDQLVEAQALARLGQPVPAVQLTMDALGKGERDSQVLFQAALIYALCGDHTHAIVQAREARQRGLSPHWFGIPGFESVRAAPDFQALLAR